MKALLGLLGDWSAGENTSLQHRLAEALTEAISSGRLASGIVLPAERTLARALGVSRSTVTATLGELKEAGLLVSRHGSGTSVAGLSSDRLSSDASGLDLIDLASSSPADAQALPEVDVDIDDLLRAGSRHGLTPAGLPELRAAVAERFTADGLQTIADEIVITNGAQHALALAFAQLTRPGDAVIVDEPTYPGVVDLMAARDLVPVPLARRKGAIDEAELARLSRDHDCRVAYLQTSVHNPTGLTADEQSFARLARQIDDLDLTVVEDLVLADLRFDGSRPGSLAALVRKAPIVVVGSVSKLGWGGLRIGWLRAPKDILEPLINSRLTDDLGSSVPSQVISTAVLQNFDVIVESRQRTLARRAELAHQMLSELVPEWEVTVPQGGLTLWIDVGAMGGSEIGERARAAGVVISVGTDSSVVGSQSSCIRLCFDRPVPQLEEGLRRLASAVAGQPTDAA